MARLSQPILPHQARPRRVVAADRDESRQVLQQLPKSHFSVVGVLLPLRRREETRVKILNLHQDYKKVVLIPSLLMHPRLITVFTTRFWIWLNLLVHLGWIEYIVLHKSCLQKAPRKAVSSLARTVRKVVKAREAQGILHLNRRRKTRHVMLVSFHNFLT